MVSVSGDDVTLNPPSDAESRMSRAAELAEYLRLNPKESRRDAEELGDQFGLGAALVAQIQVSVHSRSNAHSVVGKSAVERIKALLNELQRWAERCVEHSFAFQIAGSTIVLLAGLSNQGGSGFPVVLWLGVQAWCLLLRPQYRNVLLGSLLIAFVSGFLFFQALHAAKTSMPVPWGAISILFGITMAVLNLIVGGMLVLLGGSIQLREQRRRSAALTRQDLVVRMFDLQRQLATIPVQSPRSVHPWIAFARTRPFLTAMILVLAIASAGNACALIFHVDTYALQQAQAAQQAHDTRVGNLIFRPLVGYAPFLMIESILGLISFGFLIALGFLATTWRKVWSVAGGILAGHALTTAWAFPAGALGSTPLASAVAMPLQEVVSGLIVLLIVRFAVGFNRALATYRSGAAPDEASIVGELLEIRHRLSANPAPICVLVVDAAGSTQMKKLEDQLRVEYSFGRYQNWISQVVASHGGKVEIRTGDGAICAFGSAESALAAARELQTDVHRLNESENKLEHPFVLRVALHAGLVYADLDKVQFTEVIDVAAHTEKYSPIGGIALTDAFLRALGTPLNLPVCATVDGFEVHAMLPAC